MTVECGTLKGSLRPRSSTVKQVLLSVMYSVPWKAICVAGRWGGFHNFQTWKKINATRAWIKEAGRMNTLKHSCQTS